MPYCCSADHGLVPIVAATLPSGGTEGSPRVHATTSWPVPAYVFSGGDAVALAGAAAPIVEYLQGRNVAHNLLVFDAGRRLMLVPRKIGNFPDARKIQVASCEVLGLWVVPNQDEYDALTQDQAVALLEAAAPDETVEIVARLSAAP